MLIHNHLKCGHNISFVHKLINRLVGVGAFPSSQNESENRIVKSDGNCLSASPCSIILHTGSWEDKMVPGWNFCWNSCYHCGFRFMHMFFLE